MFASNTSQVANDAVFVEDIFSTYLYTGNGSTQTITNGIDLSGKGGLVWLKDRTTGTAGYDHTLIDTVRGSNLYLTSNSTSAQTNNSNVITGFNSNGFGIGSNTSTNKSSDAFVSWTFREQPKFFDIVTYTGNGSNRTISHNLGSVPGCIIVKCTSIAGEDWRIYHTGMGATKALRFTTDIATTNSTYWNNTDPTSTAFTVSTNSSVNQSGATYVAYLFAHNAGGFGLTGTDNVISCGSYTGSGAAQDISLGYEPQWIMFKPVNLNGPHWLIFDNMRGWNNSIDDFYLAANLTSAETNFRTAISGDDLGEPTATGFKLRTTSGAVNASGEQYIYIAIRRGPMKAPTTGTSVFARVARSGTSTYTTTTAGFPIDLAFTKARTTTSGANVVARLTSNRLLQTSASSADEADTTQDRYQTNPFDNQTSLKLGDSVNSLAFTNNSGFTYVDWMFRRAPSFMDVVCYSGTATAGQTFTHNLGVVPELMIIKKRNVLGSWVVYNKTIGATNYLDLANTNGSLAAGVGVWNSTDPTSSVFTLGVGSLTNNSSDTYINYLFATCAGVSKVGSYTGNGSSQTINCGFTSGARFVLIKRTNSTGDWYVWDTARGIVAGNDPHLSLNTNFTDVTTDDTIDTDSTGFVVNQVAATNVNVTSATYIFLAIA